MGDFRRQPSKVWWSTYEDENLSMYSSFLGWGKGVDLSGTFGEGYNNNNNNNSMNSTKNNLNLSKAEKTDANLDNSTSVFPKNDQTTQDLKEKDEADRETERKNLESDRGSSSSPSQGSHKSQDSGFSDSEIQNNGASLSPQCSPEMSKARLSCIKCQSRDESVSSVNEAETLSLKEKAYNEAVASYRKLKTSVKTTPQYKLVEFDPDVFREPEKKCLETAFDSYAEESLERGEKSADSDVKTGNAVSESVSPRRNTERKAVKSQIKKRDKINHIQNHLETSFKLPKKINLTQNLKISNIFHGKPEVKNQRTPASLKPKAKSTECITPFKPLAVVHSNGTLPKKTSSSSLDNEGFKVPKLPAEKGTNHLYDLTDIEGLPISCSTPKSSKFGGRNSPVVPAAARATEKRSATKTTFATVRKLKGLSDKKLRGSKTLLTSFNRCSSSGSFFNKVKVQVDTESAVKHWLSELETMYEAEVMTTLQSKSLAVDLTRQVTSMADTTSYTVRKLHQKTKVISLEFHRLCRQNKSKPDKHLVPLVQSLVGHVTEFINEYVPKQSRVTANDQRTADKNQKTESGTKKVEEVEEEANDSHEMITDFRTPEPETVEMKSETPRPKSKEEEVLDICENLRRLIVQNPSGDFEKIEREVANLGEKFREVVDGLLESHIQALVGVLEEPRTELALRTALSALTTLGLEGNQLGIVVSKCGGIRALLAICLEARATAVRVSALRALATVCCVADTIRQFEQAGGVEIVADILADEKRSEAELSEAAAVIAQVTAPWVQDNHSVEGLSQFLHSLVKSLTRIVNRYKSCETLLLAAAALANLTFMEPRTVWPLLECETAKILLSAVRRQGSKVSVFIQEQVATIIANMSSVPECRKHLAEQRAVVALLCFLEIPHSPLQSAPEVAAAERVLQKSAIALSRLCSDTVVAKQVVELQGATRLVRLCKEERERNHSDGVLVACLAALRKIVANCGTEALEELNAMELVEPRLLDSFLLYSSKQESYV